MFKQETADEKTLNVLVKGLEMRLLKVNIHGKFWVYSQYPRASLFQGHFREFSQQSVEK
jgi:hypothetical protein